MNEGYKGQGYGLGNEAAEQRIKEIAPRKDELNKILSDMAYQDIIEDKEIDKELFKKLTEERDAIQAEINNILEQLVPPLEASDAGRKLGSIKSEKKAKSSAANGKLGGRPRKTE